MHRKQGQDHEHGGLDHEELHGMHCEGGDGRRGDERVVELVDALVQHLDVEKSVHEPGPAIHEHVHDECT